MRPRSFLAEEYQSGAGYQPRRGKSLAAAALSTADLTSLHYYVTNLLPMKDAPTDMDAVFAALAHETRRRILDLLIAKPGAGVGEIAGGFDVSRIAIMKHLTVLEDAQLIVSEKQGRTRRLYFNAAPIQMIYDRWTDEYSAYWASEVTRLKYFSEARAATTNNKFKRGKGK